MPCAGPSWTRSGSCDVRPAGHACDFCGIGLASVTVSCPGPGTPVSLSLPLYSARPAPRGPQALSPSRRRMKKRSFSSSRCSCCCFPPASTGSPPPPTSRSCARAPWPRPTMTPPLWSMSASATRADMSSACAPKWNACCVPNSTPSPTTPARPVSSSRPACWKPASPTPPRPAPSSRGLRGTVGPFRQGRDPCPFDILLVQRRVPSDKRPKRFMLQNVGSRNARGSSQMRTGLLARREFNVDSGVPALFVSLLARGDHLALQRGSPGTGPGAAAGRAAPLSRSLRSPAAAPRSRRTGAFRFFPTRQSAGNSAQPQDGRQRPAPVPAGEGPFFPCPAVAAGRP